MWHVVLTSLLLLPARITASTSESPLCFCLWYETKKLPTATSTPCDLRLGQLWRQTLGFCLCFCRWNGPVGLHIVQGWVRVMILNRKRVDWPLWFKEELCPQVTEFKYLGVLIKSEGKIKQQIGRWIWLALAVPLGWCFWQANRKETPGKPRKPWRDYITWLAWGHLAVFEEELVEIAGVRNI